ncbi:MAG: leucine-rich repeat domain-containing protein [Promethearchaeota archaeon]|jgi:internalin A
MALSPKKIYEDLKRNSIDKSTAVDSLIYIIGNNNSFEIRLESIKTLQKIKFVNDKVFTVLEGLLVSDSNEKIRELAANCLKDLFQEKALSPLKWALEHESSLQVLISVIDNIDEIHSANTKSIFIDKIKKFDLDKFNNSLGAFFMNKEIHNFKTEKLAKIIKNYVIIKHLEERLKEVNFQTSKGFVTDLDLSFVSKTTSGWKVLNNLSQFLNFLDHLNGLELRSNNVGKFPDSIYSLGSLKYLDLSHNNLEKLPDRFSQLSSLENLNLEYNNLTEIPKSISSLTGLKILNLKHNKLADLPSAIRKLTSLEEIDLHGNQFNAIPSGLEYITSLKSLKLGLNNLESVPEWVKKLSSLKVLELGGNKSLSNFKEWIHFLPSIVELNLYNEDIRELPESIGELDSLEVLILPNNKLTKLPDSFKKLTSLKKIDLSWNDITNVPVWISSLSSLEELNLRGNQLESLPDAISSLPSLKILTITQNKNTIQVPKELQNRGIQINK